MAKVEFLATTLTKKGRFVRGDIEDFPADEAKELQRLSSVKSPAKTKGGEQKVENEPKDTANN